METRSGVRTVEVRNVEAVVGGGLFGALLGGGLMNLLEFEVLVQFRELVGSGSVDVAWLVVLALGVAFAVPFEAYLARTFDGFVSAVVALTRRSKLLRIGLVPLVKRSPMGVICYALGQGYGLAIGVVFHVLFVPLWLTYVMGTPTPFPYVTWPGLVAVFGWSVYGSMLGLVYGLVMEA